MTDIRQQIFDFELRPAIGGQDFLVTLSNQEAVKWLDNWPDWHVPALIIYGPPGCGKSHLVNVFMARSGAVPLTPALLQETGVPKLLESLVCCVVDDAEKGFDEEALLHLYNGLATIGGHIMMTATTAPSRWGIVLKDLESRLKSMPSVKIGLPDDRLLEAVLAKHFSDRQLLVSADVVAYLLPRIERSMSVARQIVHKIDRHSLSAGSKITLPFVRQVLAMDFDNHC